MHRAVIGQTEAQWGEPGTMSVIGPIPAPKTMAQLDLVLAQPPEPGKNHRSVNSLAPLARR